MQLDTSELRYKEYKAYVPPKWAAFDKAGKTGGLSKKERGFSHYLAGGGESKVNHEELRQVEDAYSSDSDDGKPGRQGKKSEEWKRNWTQNMIMYVKQQELKAEAKKTTLQLQENLKNRQRKVQERREKEVEAPVLASIAAKSSFMAQKKVDEKAAMKYNTLLRTAVEANHAHNRDKVDAFFAQKQDERRVGMEKHLEKIDRVDKERTRNIKEQSRNLAHNVSYRESVATKNREHLEEEKARKVESEHQAALKKDDSIQRKREKAAKDRHENLVEHNAEIARRVSNSKKKLEEKRQKFEAKLAEGFEESNTRMMLLDAKRKQKNDLQLTENALMRAKEARAKARNAQLADCEKMEKRREVQLQMKEETDKEHLAEMRARNATRLKVSNNVLDTQWRERSAKIDESIEFHHKAQPRTETPEVSETFLDLQRHLEQKRQVDEDKERRRLAGEARGHAMEQLAAERESRENLKRHKAFVAAEEHRLNTFHQAEDRKQAFEDKTVDAATKRQQQSEKHLAEFLKERDSELKQKSMEKSAKIHNSLELVNVEKHNELVKELRTKEKKQSQKKAARETENEARLAEERESRAMKQAHMTAMIQGERKRREIKNEHEMAKFNEKARLAQAQRDDHLDGIRSRLGKQYSNRVSMTEAAAKKREANFLSGCKNLHEKEERWANERSNQLEELSMQRKERATEKRRTIEQHQEEARNQLFEKTNRTIDKLERTYSRGPASPAARGFSATRARSAMN